VDPDGTWFHVPREVQAQVWPTEDYEVAASYVPVAEGEDDLFAGLPDDVERADAMARTPGLRLVHDSRKERAA
ncbi:MAG TPA: mycothiol conjugate amidase Mca, partial [Phycicoccus sp.]